MTRLAPRSTVIFITSISEFLRRVVIGHVLAVCLPPRPHAGLRRDLFRALPELPFRHAGKKAILRAHPSWWAKMCVLS